MHKNWYEYFFFFFTIMPHSLEVSAMSTSGVGTATMCIDYFRELPPIPAISALPFQTGALRSSYAEDLICL